MMSNVLDKGTSSIVTSVTASVPAAPTERNSLVSLMPITSTGDLQRYGLSDLLKADRAPRRRWLPSPLFIFLVIVPVLAGALYNFIIASDRFVSTASFVVRETNRAGLLSIGGSGAMTRSDDDSFAIAEFITSRDAVNWLTQNESLAELFASPDIDYFSRFPSILTGSSREDLYKHFQHYVEVDFNSSTGISTISIQGFNPESAKRLTTALLDAAEALINNLNARARQDSLSFAASVVKEAEQRMSEAQQKITAFRNTERVINPDSDVAISNLLLTEMLRAQSETNAQIAQLLAASPKSPALVQLRQRRDALSRNIDAQRALMAGSDNSFAAKMEGYDRVRLERDLTERALVAAMDTRDAVTQESQQGHLYLQRVVEPNEPDRYGYPKRYWNMLLLLGVCLGLFWIVLKTTELFAEPGS